MSVTPASVSTLTSGSPSWQRPSSTCTTPGPQPLVQPHAQLDAAAVVPHGRRVALPQAARRRVGGMHVEPVRPFDFPHPVEVAELRVDAIARLARQQLQREARRERRLVALRQRGVVGHRVHAPSSRRLLRRELDPAGRRREPEVGEGHVPHAVGQPGARLQRFQPSAPPGSMRRTSCRDLRVVAREVASCRTRSVRTAAARSRSRSSPRPAGRTASPDAARTGCQYAVHEVLLLEHRLRRQDVVREPRGVGHELIDDDEEVEACEGVAHEARARVLAGRVALLDPRGARRGARPSSASAGPEPRHGDRAAHARRLRAAAADRRGSGCARLAYCQPPPATPTLPVSAGSSATALIVWPAWWWRWRPKPAMSSAGSCARVVEGQAVGWRPPAGR